MSWRSQAITAPATEVGSTRKPLLDHCGARLYLPLLVYEEREMIPLPGTCDRDIVGTKMKTHNNRKALWKTNIKNNKPGFVACGYGPTVDLYTEQLLTLYLLTCRLLSAVNARLSPPISTLEAFRWLCLVLLCKTSPLLNLDSVGSFPFNPTGGCRPRFSRL